MSKKQKPLDCVDPDDALPCAEQDVTRAEYHIGGIAVTRAQAQVQAQAEIAKLVRGRPKAESTKLVVKLRLDSNLPAMLSATGDGWQTRDNRILRERFAMRCHCRTYRFGPQPAAASRVGIW